MTTEPRLARKARGAFYTPVAMADYMTQWAIRSPSDTVLEPSCGQAAFLTAGIRRLAALGARNLRRQLHGLDIHPEALEVAAQELSALGAEAHLEAGDFFDFRSDHRFDAIIGNPPYVRYQSFVGEAREKAQRAALAQGVRLPGLASSWAAFVIHAASFLQPSGRMALVLPGELLSVNYAAPVRRFLMERFAKVRVVVFQQRVFPDVLEEVVLLLAEGTGGTDRCEIVQAIDTEDLETLDRSTWIPEVADGKWVAALLPATARGIYDELATGGAFSPLLAWGETNLGMVTGNNKYFTLTRADADQLALNDGELLKISPPGSRHLRGLTFTQKLWETLTHSGSRGYLFDPDPAHPSATAKRYIHRGEAAEVHLAYKCRVRKPWWKVPRVDLPDLFLTYMNHDAPRLVSNRARMLYLNSVHGVVLRPGLRRIGKDLLPLAALNSLTLLGAELVGRSYGGGMLKLEPKEADRLPVPSHETLAAAQEALRELRPRLTHHQESGDLTTMVTLVDGVLLRERLGISDVDVQHLREARQKLFFRRAARAKGSSGRLAA